MMKEQARQHSSQELEFFLCNSMPVGCAERTWVVCYQSAERFVSHLNQSSKKMENICRILMVRGSESTKTKVKLYLLAPDQWHHSHVICGQLQGEVWDEESTKVHKEHCTKSAEKAWISVTWAAQDIFLPKQLISWNNEGISPLCF